MRLTPLIWTTLAIALLLNGCTNTRRSPTQVASNIIQRQHVVAMSDLYYPSKNPEAVSIYGEEKQPHAPYRVIGVATISKYNLLGVHRQSNTMNNMMKNLAASIGGDGIINVSESNEAMQAHVIAYQKILI